MKRHTSEEIAEKLRQASVLAGRGQSQSQICKSLGVSVMTFHRWRKQIPHYMTAAATHAEAAAETARPSRRGVSDDALIQELQLENSRLRRIVTDLLLEKTKIEEAIEKRSARVR
jgi:putative transposase